jgi:hypothetical protein
VVTDHVHSRYQRTFHDLPATTFRSTAAAW